VWYGRYSLHIGRAKVPSLADLYSARLQAVGYWAFLSGLLLTGIAAVVGHEAGVRVGSSFLFVSISTLVLNTGLMLRHFFWPTIGPLRTSSTAKPLPAEARRSPQNGT